jgi:hypothetical protein
MYVRLPSIISEHSSWMILCVVVAAASADVCATVAGAAASALPIRVGGFDAETPVSTASMQHSATPVSTPDAATPVSTPDADARKATHDPPRFASIGSLSATCER